MEDSTIKQLAVIAVVGVMGVFLISKGEVNGGVATIIAGLIGFVAPSPFGGKP